MLRLAIVAFLLLPRFWGAEPAPGTSLVDGDPATWTKLAARLCLIGPEWTCYDMPLAPGVELKRNTHALTLGLGTGAHTIEIADVQILAFGAEMPLGKLPSSFAAAPAKP